MLEFEKRMDKEDYFYKKDFFRIVKNIKKQICKIFSDRKQKKDCITEFNKNFIKSFISARENQI